RARGAAAGAGVRASRLLKASALLHITVPFFALDLMSGGGHDDRHDVVVLLTGRPGLDRPLRAVWRLRVPPVAAGGCAHAPRSRPPPPPPPLRPPRPRTTPLLPP